MIWANEAFIVTSPTSLGWAPAKPQAPKPSLLSTGPGPAWPPTPHFYRRRWASPAPNPSLLSARPLTSVGQTPRFYWPDPSLLLARPLASISQAAPCRTVPGPVGTVPDYAMPAWAVSPCRLDTGTPLVAFASPGYNGCIYKRLVACASRSILVSHAGYRACAA